jgi:hypothetical protein
LYSAKCYWDEGKEQDMGRACSMVAREEKCMQRYGKKTVRKESTRKT